LHRVFHSIRFKVNKGWSTAVLLFLYPLVKLVIEWILFWVSRKGMERL